MAGGRLQLIDAKKALTRQGDQLAQMRQQLPTPKETGLTGTRGRGWRDDTVVRGLAPGQGEASDGRPVVETLMFSDVVVVLNPRIDGRSGLFDGGEDLAVEELALLRCERSALLPAELHPRRENQNSALGADLHFLLVP